MPLPDRRRVPAEIAQQVQLAVLDHEATFDSIAAKFGLNRKTVRRIIHNYPRAETAARNAGHRRWREANPERYLANKRAWQAANKDRIAVEQREKYARNPAAFRDKLLYTKYRIRLEDTARMHAAQNGVCAICREAIPLRGRGVAVDHCHQTGRVRGLLCSKCNTGLGQFRDRPDFLTQAVQYLQKWEIQ